jgi:hypothetical protein
MRNRKVLFTFALLLVCIFSFVSVSHAFLWLLGGAVRAGVIAIGSFLTTELGKQVLRVALDYVAIGAAAYLYYDRGAAPPPSEKYVQVSLPNTKATVSAMKDEGKVLKYAPSSGWATGRVNLQYQYTNPCGYARQGYDPSPAGTTFCASADTHCSGTTVYSSERRVGSWETGCPHCELGQGNWNVCTQAQKDGYAIAPEQLDADATYVWSNADLKGRITDSIGRDMQAGGTLVESKASAGLPTIVVGADGASKEFPEGYADSDVNDWLATSPSYSTAVDNSSVVSGLASVKTSADAVKTSVDAVKTSVDAAKTSVDAAKTSVDGVKASVDAINAKIPSGSYTGGSGSGHGAYSAPSSTPFATSWGTFKTNMQGTAMFGLASGFFTAVPSSGQAGEYVINGGATFGSHAFQFSWLTAAFVVLRSIVIVACSYVAVRIVVLKH